MAIQTTNPASSVQFGITNCGPGSTAMLISANTNPWTMYALSFTTGPTNTSAQIYLNVSNPNGATPVYADDFGFACRRSWRYRRLMRVRSSVHLR